MAASNKTPLGFNQWISSDKPKREDFNADNLLADAQLQKKVEASGTVQASYLFAKRMMCGSDLATAPTIPWYKVASIVPTAANSDYSSTFHVHDAYITNAPKNSGVLRVNFRTNYTSPGGSRLPYIGWEYVSGFDPASFVLAYSPSSDNPFCELWVKVASQYGRILFEMITEGTREARNSNLWTVYNMPTGVAAIPANMLQKISEVMPLLQPTVSQASQSQLDSLEKLASFSTMAELQKQITQLQLAVVDSGSQDINIHASLVDKGEILISEVPKFIRNDVQATLDQINDSKLDKSQDIAYNNYNEV